MKQIQCRHCGAMNDYGAKTCDDCGRYMTGSKAEHNHDPNNGQCAWTAGGQRCTNAGTMTDSTQGSDTWFCSAHYGCSDGKLGQQVMIEAIRSNARPDFSIEARKAKSLAAANAAVPEEIRKMTLSEHRKNFTESIAKFGQRKREGRYVWAYKIIDMIERGEHVPMITEQHARKRLAEHAAQ